MGWERCGASGRTIVAILALALVVVVGASGCGADDGASGPGVVFIDAGGAAPDGGASGPDGGVYDGGGGGLDVVTSDSGGPADSGVASDSGCTLESPYRDFPVVTGALSSYSRGEAHPSIRQWTDRARDLGYRGFIFADHMRRTSGSLPVDQFSDANPDVAIQHVFRFDAVFDMLAQNGAGALARVITKDDEPELTFDPGISLRGVEDGWASASYEDTDGFDYDLQDVSLMVRLKVPRKAGASRVLLRAQYGLKQNKKDIVWVLSWSGDPGEGVQADFNAGANFHTFHLPLKEMVIRAYGDLIWKEGALWLIELRVEGDAEAVFDHTRLRVDAWFDVYRDETRQYSDSQLQFIPAVEHYFATPLGQFNCVGPDSFPASDKDVDTGLIDDFHDAGCFVIADRPLSPGAGIDRDRVMRADAVEVWHPAFTVDGQIDTVWWDDLLLDKGPFPALASVSPRDIRGLTATVPHNRVLATALSEDSLLEAIAAGRSYMTDDLGVEAELWAERPGCRRLEMGMSAADATKLHARVSCPDGVASAQLVRIALPSGERVEMDIQDAVASTAVDVSSWPNCYVRLEAVCNGGARVFTNPLWLTSVLP